MRFPKSMIGLAVCALSVLALPLDASAGTLRLRVDDGLGHGVVLTDDGDGFLSFTGISVGAFTLSVTNAISAPLLGNQDRSEMHLDSVNVTSTTGGTLTLTVEGSGFTAVGVGPAQLTSTLGGSFGMGGGSITTQSWVNTSNLVPNLGPNGAVSPTSFVAPPGSISTAPQYYTSQAFSGQSTVEFVGIGTYSLFSKTIFTLGANSVGSFNLNTSVATPEPASLMLLGSGLLGIARLARRRRQVRG